MFYVEALQGFAEGGNVINVKVLLGQLGGAPHWWGIYRHSKIVFFLRLHNFTFNNFAQENGQIFCKDAHKFGKNGQEV